MMIEKEENLQAKMLTQPVYLTIYSYKISSYALTNTGVEGKTFINKNWAIL